MRSFDSDRRIVARNSTATVLYVSDRNGPLASHRALMQEAGYELKAVSSLEQAIALVENFHPDVVVIGHAVGLSERTAIEGAAKQQDPKPCIVLLYEHSIVQTEQADAVLNINSDPHHLVQTIQYLLTGAIIDRSN